MANDVFFDHEIGRAADQDKMLDIVAANEHEATAGIDDGGIEYRETRLTVAGAAGVGSTSAPKLTDQPGGEPDERQHQHEGDDETRGQTKFQTQNVTHPFLPINAATAALSPRGGPGKNCRPIPNKPLKMEAESVETAAFPAFINKGAPALLTRS
jgi:hypothetical protein